MKNTGVGIVAFSFGAPSNIVSNKQIADVASRKAHALNVPVYTQRDINIGYGVEAEYADEVASNPPPTLRMARGAVRWANKRRLRKILIVAARPHLSRVMRDMKEAVCESGARIKVRVCHKVKLYPQDSWFCPESTQDRTRSWQAWYKREKIIWLVPFFLYKLFAK